ncbi:MAG: MltA domain-containing protein [Pseudomonadota bacterium]
MAVSAISSSLAASDRFEIEPLEFSDIAGWGQDDHAAAWKAFYQSARRMADHPPKTRAFGVSGQDLSAIARKALHTGPHIDGEAARHFFETYFTAHALTAPQQHDEDGFVTGFFEPEVSASRVKTDRFRYPLYARPMDLVDVTDANRPPDMHPTMRYGRWTESGLEEYADRAAIQTGALEGKGLEIAWLESLQDQFFIHVQGAARLTLTDGGLMRVTFAAKSGHPYTSLAKTLCACEGIAPEWMTSHRLLDWMAQDEGRALDLLTHNRSYIFFRTVEQQDPAEGPVAAAKVPLTPYRSLAVDRTLHTFGTPFFVTTKEPLPGDTRPFAHLMVAQDTGSAITGPRRGDIFCGTGQSAGLQAGRVRHQAQFIILMPKPNLLS